MASPTPAGGGEDSAAGELRSACVGEVLTVLVSHAPRISAMATLAKYCCIGHPSLSDSEPRGVSRSIVLSRHRAASAARCTLRAQHWWLFLAKQPPAGSIAELQGKVDRFVDYYNEVRPHRARGRRTPRAAFEARDKARPSGPKIRVEAGMRVRRDRIDTNGKVTLRRRTRLHHIGVGHAHTGTRVIMLVDGLDVRVVSEDGELLRHLTLDPNRDYQPQG